MERVKTNIPGLDELIQGGIPKNDLVLLSGTCGAGKTVFGLQYLCLSNDMPGIYISFEEDVEQIRNTAKSFSWDIEPKEKDNTLRFLQYDPFKIEDIFEVIENNIREMNAGRVVIDSISSLGIYVKDSAELRRMILQINKMLRKNKCTSILISEVLPNQKALSRFGMEEFVTDGVIVLHNFFVSGKYRRGISIWKMRSTNHSRSVHPYEINNHGFVVYPQDTIAVNNNV